MPRLVPLRALGRNTVATASSTQQSVQCKYYASRIAHDGSLWRVTLNQGSSLSTCTSVSLGVTPSSRLRPACCRWCDTVTPPSQLPVPVGTELSVLEVHVHASTRTPRSRSRFMIQRSALTTVNLQDSDIINQHRLSCAVRKARVTNGDTCYTISHISSRRSKRLEATRSRSSCGRGGRGLPCPGLVTAPAAWSSLWTPAPAHTLAPPHTHAHTPFSRDSHAKRPATPHA